MAKALTSKKLLTLFRDKLRDQEKVKERSDGIIYDLFTEGELYFMEVLRTSKLPLPLVLFAGQDEYPLNRNVIEIVDWHFSKETLNPLFEMPRGSYDTVRSIKLTNPPVRTPLGTTETTDAALMITNGDILTLDVFFKPDDGHVIDDEHDPIIERTFHRLLVQYALSFYKDFTYVVDGKEIRSKNNFISKEEVYEQVRRKRDTMYGLNSIQLINANFIRM